VSVDVAAFFQIPGSVDAIFDIDNAPIAFQPLAIRPAITGASAVIHIDDGETAARPVLNGQTQSSCGRAGPPAMADHEQRRTLTGGPCEVLAPRRIEKREGCPVVRCLKFDRLRNRKISLVNTDLQASLQNLKIV